MNTKLYSLLLVSLQLHVLGSLGAEVTTKEKFVAHEWGTFTSVQGADGIQMEWNPLVTSDLPKFVYDLNRPTGDIQRARYSAFVSKSSASALQRMETPVIYFYSPEQKNVTVNVRFPEGVITEWYPQAIRPDLAVLQLQSRTQTKNSALEWRNFKVLPGPNQADGLLLDPSGSHYYAARATDSALLSIPNPLSKKLETEKFLFYRGVGHFKAPLEVTLGGGEEYLSLANTGKEALEHLFVLQVQKGEARFSYLPALTSGDSKSVKVSQVGMKSIPSVQAEVEGKLAKALVEQGLYEKEAKAMVATWHDSWFGEEGLRVLYILNGKWADRVLPLTITPTPDSTVRVMVGRAEVITPNMEWQLLQQIARFASKDDAVRRSAVEEARKIGLGRFAEPAVRRVIGKNPSKEFSQLAYILLHEASKAENPKPLASR